MIKGEAYLPDSDVAEMFALMAAEAQSGEIDWRHASDSVHAQVLDAVLGVGDSIMRSADYRGAAEHRPFPEPPPELVAHSKG